MSEACCCVTNDRSCEHPLCRYQALKFCATHHCYYHPQYNSDGSCPACELSKEISLKGLSDKLDKIWDRVKPTDCPGCFNGRACNKMMCNVCNGRGEV